MKKEKKNEPVYKLAKLTIECSEHGLVEINSNDVYFTETSEDCEMCGSHGNIKVRGRCPECDKHFTIELSSW